MSFTTRPELIGTRGMVASTHWLASCTGMAVLERGGNAFDAAVAAGLVLQVVEPHLNGPCGEAPIIFAPVGDGAVRVIDGQGPAPAAASASAFADLGLDLVPGTGLLAACVPGAFDAWMHLLAEHGTMTLGEVMADAIAYAGSGYPVVPRITATIEGVEEQFRRAWPSSAQVYLGSGVPQPGTLFRNPDLARTYDRIVTEAEGRSSDRVGQIEAARDVFYRGFVAEALVRFSAGTEVLDASGRHHRGLLSAQDLASYRVRVEEPTRYDFGPFTVCKTGPWGQGPVFLQQLALLSGFDLAAMEPGGADLVHVVVEAAKLAFADREAWYGDPTFVEVPLDRLLDPDHVGSRRSLIGPEASYEIRPGTVDGWVPPTDPVRTGIGAAGAGTGEPTLDDVGARGRPPDGDTCHLDVVDRHGNMVSATPSGGWLQSSPVVPGLGFGLGTRAQVFSLLPGAANGIAGGKRPRTTLSPSLALRDGAPYLAFGTPGGDTQDQVSLQFFLNHAVFGMDLQAAIDAPTFHTTHFPSSFYPRLATPGRVVVEGRFSPSVVAELKARGHDVVVDGPWSIGRMSAVAHDRDRGVFKAAANPRGMQGYAVGR